MYFTNKTQMPDLEEFLERGAFDAVTSLVLSALPKMDLSWISKCTNLRWLDLHVQSVAAIDLSRCFDLALLHCTARASESIIGLEKLLPLREIRLHSASPEEILRIGSRARSLWIYGPPAVMPTFSFGENVTELTVISAKKSVVNVAGIGSLKNLKELNLWELSKGLEGCYMLDRLENLEKVSIDKVATVDDVTWALRLSKLERMFVGDPLPFPYSDHDRLIQHGLLYR